ncbi:hypothetical protein PTSG_02558 [Salpingoeca rosetta]|uniref:Ubiquitin-activating enzyme SCCH domain-containing protein n=1 Tax=Salpingoeca rosetta (strain ATCC 50818 / BSB-021) TaxID=946362 RepID=F2U2J1_SALR5|nr:uncharacterized protein PTSG_02558 [Salpingoeca rosetta]EGD81843.1 hypothetical protein PTSG_02558 [Salpingoeca rosetta]|eukprot:XP_004997047.1 hypothetical protein PTSG_02558 [Salpingoeca rosetta]
MCVYKEGVVAQGLVKFSSRYRPIHQLFNFNVGAEDKCVLYEKLLLESVTMRTGANVHVIVPHTTNSCSDGGDAEAGMWRHPHVHAAQLPARMEWVRAKFTDLFVSPVSQLQQFLEDPEGFISSRAWRRRLSSAWVASGSAPWNAAWTCSRPSKTSPHSCKRSRRWRRAKTKSGEPFWSGHKIFPEALEFDPQNPLHKAFLIAVTNLYACVFKVHPTKYPSEENKLHIKRTSLPRTSRTSSSQADTHSYPRLSQAAGSCPSASSEQGGYSYVNASPDGRLLVAESFVWGMHGLACKQRMPVTATDMVWTKDGKHLICPSYSPTPACTCAASVHMRLNAQSSSGIFPGAELACAAASDGTLWVTERWQKVPYECKLHRVPDLKCLAVVPSTFEHTRYMAVTPTLYIAGNKTGVISLWQLGEPSTLLAEWRADVVGNGEETIQDVGGEEARGEVEAETASKERVRTAVDALRVTPDGRFLVTASTSTDLRVWDLSTLTSTRSATTQHEGTAAVAPTTTTATTTTTRPFVFVVRLFADSSNKLASACGNTVHVCAIDHHQQQQQQQQQQEEHHQQQQQQQHVNGSSGGVSSALTRVAVLDDLFVDEAEPNANMTAATMATHPTDDSLLAIDTARDDVFVVCDVADHKVLSKLKVSRNAPVKFGVFARRSSILFVNSVESVIKCDYSTGQHTTILHRNDRADDMVVCYHQHPLTVSSSVLQGRVALWALGPTLNRAMILHTATPDAAPTPLCPLLFHQQHLPQKRIAVLPSSAKHFDMAKKMMEAAALSSFVLDCLIHLA